MNINRWSHWALMCGVIAISFSPLAVKLVSFTPVVSAFYRSFYAALFFAVFCLFSKKEKLERGNLKWLVPSVIAGAFLGIDLIVWHKTIVYLGAGPATFLGNSQIVFVTIFAAFVFKEKIPLRFYFSVLAVMAGLYLLIPAVVTDVTRNVGYMLGIVVGITYAGMLIGLRYAKMLSKEKYPELFSLAAVFLASSIIIGVYAAGVEHSALIVPDIKSHIVMALTALLCQTIGWYLINSSIISVPAHEGSLMLMLQPVLATIWGCLLFKEPSGGVQVLGIVMSLGGIIFYQMRKVKPHTHTEPFAE